MENPSLCQKIPSVSVLGVKIHLTDMQSAVGSIFNWENSNKQYQINTPNPEQIVLAQENEEFRLALNKGDLNIPDGTGLVWAINKLKAKSSMLKARKVERVGGVDLMTELCKEAAKRGKKVFLLGGKGGVAEKAAGELAKSLKLKAESHAGAENIKEETEKEREEAIKRINAFQPDFLFVAYGAPYQEMWIAKNLPHLKVKVAMSVGGAFDYISGSVRRAPAWIRRAGFEWLYRLIRQPWRWKRQLEGLKFFRLILKDGP